MKTDQTGWMLRLIWVFAGCTCHFVGFVVWWLIFLTIAVLMLTSYEPAQNKTIKMSCARSKDPDQSVHPPSLTRDYAMCSIGSLGIKVSAFDSEDCSVWANAQADLSLRWLHRSFCWFCPAQADIESYQIMFQHYLQMPVTGSGFILRIFFPHKRF